MNVSVRLMKCWGRRSLRALRRCIIGVGPLGYGRLADRRWRMMFRLGVAITIPTMFSNRVIRFLGRRKIGRRGVFAPLTCRLMTYVRRRVRLWKCGWMVCRCLTVRGLNNRRVKMAGLVGRRRLIVRVVS